MKRPVGATIHTWINALSIPLIAGILVMVLWWTLDAEAWCGANMELSPSAALRESLLCKDIIIKQLQIALYVSVGLVATLSLAHLVSVFRDVKAQVGIDTKFGKLNVGGDSAAQGADYVANAADKAADEVKE